ncbi:mannose-6-phosphate isomerase [Thermosipho sp. 1063]|uniref:type I phosphomannose isomerase catalytic subunit n=1 Tax=unclassified Thermosipho (in: thermotogales) TaxID=2676525 RepID=UPI000949368D|nr:MULTISPECIES: type I phosphomannose isomerase catalytic subunit [unclassified Thermosipho (in: thermotogales)]ANQ54388.1 mannose-6-phosphate isomerase [Thermosipho sp. 1070]APT72833.1 mannose-6-phosphate isomerase [Thermosipho sp. 1063]OOC42267.1 mannose-6-phosphate isomerase [Thermosipho sp. 1074]
MIKVRPQFRNQIWGNKKINEIFGIKEGKIGEIWLVSGHPLFTTLVDGKDINEISESLCGERFERFPLLVKLISTSDWLSLQVHPDDEYAKIVENEPWGKNEAWYFLSDGEIAICEEPSLIPRAVKEGNWQGILKILKVKKGTFVNIPAGIIHALGPNSTVIEVQQSSDLTYRIYDWGRPRETHLKKALEVAKSVKFKDLFFDRIDTKYFKMDVVKNCKIDGFSIVVPEKIDKNFGASIIPRGSKEDIYDSIVIRLGEFFLNS